MRYLGSLVTAVLVLIVTIGVGLYVDRKHEAMHTRNASVTVGLERMVRLNQAMDSVLRAAVHEQNGLRASGYDTLQQELEVTMKGVVKDSLDLPLTSEIAALAGDHLTLRQVETRALVHIQREQWQEARAVLFDERFVLSRKIYEINSETTVGALTGELAAITAGLDEMKQGVLAAPGVPVRVPAKTAPVVAHQLPLLSLSVSEVRSGASCLLRPATDANELG